MEINGHNSHTDPWCCCFDFNLEHIARTLTTHIPLTDKAKENGGDQALLSFSCKLFPSFSAMFCMPSFPLWSWSPACHSWQTGARLNSLPRPQPHAAWTSLSLQAAFSTCSILALCTILTFNVCRDMQDYAST